MFLKLKKIIALGRAGHSSFSGSHSASLPCNLWAAAQHCHWQSMKNVELGDSITFNIQGVFNWNYEHYVNNRQQQKKNAWQFFNE